MPSRTDSARFIIAAIGGGAVGLFNNFTLGESFPPLAIAFLVGYATDIFFSFLDRVQQSFTKGAEEAAVPARLIGFSRRAGDPSFRARRPSPSARRAGPSRRR